ncbi:ABC transporter permease [Pseudonocardia sp. CNS-139]|nr:ABC transporter permease [Pseudonocardia sp. CNS-139]
MDSRLRRGAPATTVRPPRRARQALVLAGLAVTLLACVLLAVGAGPVAVHPATTVQVVGSHLLPQLVAPVPDPLDDQIIWEFRFPRVLLGVVVGAGLAVVGAVMQAVVRNPLADPYLLGVSAGAALGAVLVLVLGSAAAAGLSLPAAAFGGALVSTLAIYLLARRRGRITPLRMVLAGVALAYLFQAGYSYLLLIADPRGAQSVLFWLLGSLGSARWDALPLPTAVVALGTVALLTQSRPLNALLTGDESARSLGLGVDRFRAAMLVLTSVLVGTMVAVSGAIAFVGLIVPHAVRLVLGADHRRLMPAAALVGAIFLVLVDLAARTVAEPTELPLTIVTAVVGVPFFLWLLGRDTSAERIAG